MPSSRSSLLRTCVYSDMASTPSSCAEPTHADRIDPFAVGERHSGAEDALSRQGRSASWARRSFGSDA